MDRSQNRNAIYCCLGTRRFRILLFKPSSLLHPFYTNYLTHSWLFLSWSCFLLWHFDFLDHPSTQINCRCNLTSAILVAHFLTLLHNDVFLENGVIICPTAAVKSTNILSAIICHLCCWEIMSLHSTEYTRWKSKTIFFLFQNSLL